MSFHLPVFAFLLLSLALLSCGSPNRDVNRPVVFDEDLELSLFAGNPQIVTPIGLAVDDLDALYILESHTHSPPSNYPGPKGDLIKRVEDTDGDQIPDQWSVFASGITNGANLAIRDGVVYVTAKKYLLAFTDFDHDGVSDVVDTLVVLDPPEYIYDHAGLLGIAIGPDGWVYCSRGNLGGKAWILKAKDGSSLEGYGTGGMIFRCKPQGRQLEAVASGFWNPFDIKFTHDGRLLATDNDPDSRGPNRLLEIVEGGDYGFECLYGGSGLHPFLAWNGELPGTIGMVSALGEAPCALIDAQFTNFGNDFRNTVLVNIWEEKNIVRIPIRKNGTSIQGIPEVLVQGDTSFHPVAMAVDSKGNLYISDWVRRHYPNHGQGKIWRLESKSKQPVKQDIEPSKVERELTELTNAQLFARLDHADNYEFSVIRDRLKTDGVDVAVLYLTNPDANKRLQGLLILLKSGYFLPSEILSSLLRDDHETIRKMALIYTGKKMRVDQQSVLFNILREDRVGSDLFEIYLATLQHLQPEFITNYQEKSGITADKQKNKLPANFIENILVDKKISGAIRAMALPYLKDLPTKKYLLLELLSSTSDQAFTVSLLKAIRSSGGTKLSSLETLVENVNLDSRIRAEAIFTVNQEETLCQTYLELLKNEKSDLVLYSLVKYLVLCSEDKDLYSQVKDILVEKDDEYLWQVWNDANKDEALPDRSEFQDVVNLKGDRDRGKLIFQSNMNQCESCHRINGWGGTIGPDLSKIGSSKSRSQLIQAVLNPSLEIAPEWQGWYVIDSSGSTHIGRQIDVHENRAELMNLDGNFDNYPHPRDYGVLSHSIMPDGLERNLTFLEFNDLITYLENLR